MARKPHAPDTPVFTVAVAAELVGVHSQTLRNYEKIELLVPQRTQGGARRYSEEDIVRLVKIKEMVDEGINTSAIKRILELEQQIAVTLDELETLRAQAAAEIKAVQRRYRPEIEVWKPQLPAEYPSR